MTFSPATVGLDGGSNDLVLRRFGETAEFARAVPRPLLPLANNKYLKDEIMKTGPTYRFLLLVVVILALVTFGPALSAQTTQSAAAKPDSPTPSGDGWHVDVVPYIWFAGIQGSTGINGHNASIDATPGEVLDYLNLGFMGTVEARYNRFLLPMDFMWVKLTDKKAFSFDEGATNAKVEFKQTVFTPAVGYRLVDTPKFIVDSRFGIRYWHLDSSLNITGPEVNTGVNGTANWVDAVAGGKIQAALGRKVFIAVFGDAGGGQARSDWEAGGLLGMRIAKKWTIQGGYRYLSVNYRPQSTFVYDVNQSGIILGATWSVK